MERVHYLIIGAGLAAHHAVRGIRERDTEGRILLIGDEPELPYTRPHLSKAYLLGQRPREKVYAKPASFYEEHKVEVWTNRRATAIDAAQKSVSLADGVTLGFEQLLLATGGEPRRLKVPGSDLRGVYYLRTLADSDAIRAAMLAAKQAVIVGGGFIGAEVASAFAQTGVDTTMIVKENVLLKRQVGREAGEFLLAYYRDKGVKVELGQTVNGFTGHGQIQAVHTANGATVPADTVVAGVGITPRTDLASAAGLRVEHGVMVDEYLRTSSPDIYAAGDIAYYYDTRYGRQMRLEHWDNAVQQGKQAGLNMAGADRPFEHVPYFYSDVFDLDLQAWGDMYDWNRTLVRGSHKNNLAYFYLKDDRLKAVLLVDPTKEQGAAAEKLVAGVPVVQDEARYRDPTVPFEALT
ncbi:MAG TPA: FAD-dependent oxidoreductase [Anaerolineae bacterium]|nr:FAD-dependent oxidoreductase [Anaerolineae bacterium]